MTIWDRKTCYNRGRANGIIDALNYLYERKMFGDQDYPPRACGNIAELASDIYDQIPEDDYERETGQLIGKQQLTLPEAE